MKHKSDIFYVLYVDDIRLSAYLDTIRLLCDPTISDPVHVTVRGPYKGKNYRKTAKWTAFVANNIYFRSIDSFFDAGQNTVFVSCTVPDLETVWWKPSYADGHCHITLYDGTSRTFAEKLFDLLISFDWRFTVPTGMLAILKDRGPQHDLATWSRRKAVEKETGLDLSWHNIVDTDQSTRLGYIR